MNEDIDENESTLEEASSDAFLTRQEFEAVWDEARRVSDTQYGDLFVFPVLLLYTGFFFGPLMTAFFALVVLRGRMHLRHFAFVLGVAGVAWCLSQGITAMQASTWDNFSLQFARSTVNFVAGIATYALVRSEVKQRYRPSRATLLRTILAVIALIGLFFLIPTHTAITLGR